MGYWERLPLHQGLRSRCLPSASNNTRYKISSIHSKIISVQCFPVLLGIIAYDLVSPQQTTSQESTVTLSFKCLSRLSQWRVSRAVTAPGERERVQIKDALKKNELRLTGSLVEFLTSSSSLYPRTKRETVQGSSRISQRRFRTHRQIGDRESAPLPEVAQLLPDVSAAPNGTKWHSPLTKCYKTSGRSSRSLAKTMVMNSGIQDPCAFVCLVHVWVRGQLRVSVHRDCSPCVPFPLK